MDVQTLAKEVVTFLAPFLPYLVKVGEEAAKEAGKKFGEAAWEQAKALWGKLRPKVEAKPAAQEAVQDAAAAPDDPDAQAALRLQLKKLLAEDQALAEKVAALLRETRVQADVRVGDVFSGGEVTGVEAETISSADVRSRVEADKVTGKVTGVSAKRIGGEHKE